MRTMTVDLLIEKLLKAQAEGHGHEPVFTYQEGRFEQVEQVGTTGAFAMIGSGTEILTNVTQF